MRGTIEWQAGVRALLDDVGRFTEVAGTRPLRPYQAEVARRRGQRARRAR